MVLVRDLRYRYEMIVWTRSVTGRMKYAVDPFYDVAYSVRCLIIFDCELYRSYSVRHLMTFDHDLRRIPFVRTLCEDVSYQTMRRCQLSAVKLCTGMSCQTGRWWAGSGWSVFLGYFANKKSLNLTFSTCITTSLNKFSKLNLAYFVF